MKLGQPPKKIEKLEMRLFTIEHELNSMRKLREEQIQADARRNSYYFGVFAGAVVTFITTMLFIVL